SVGSSSTMGGLLVGKELHGLHANIIGVSVSRKKTEVKERIIKQIKSFSNYFNININTSMDNIYVYDDYIEEGYTITTKVGEIAIQIFDEEESVFIDQKYIDNGASELLDLIDTVVFEPTDNIIFIHTGGAPAILD